jgi:hypothetical protein
MKHLIAIATLCIVAITLLIIQHPISAAQADFVRVLQREQALEQSHATYFVVVYVITGHVPASQGQIVEVGADYFCVQHAPSKECFVLDKVSSVDFYDGQ